MELRQPLVGAQRKRVKKNDGPALAGLQITHGAVKEMCVFGCHLASR